MLKNLIEKNRSYRRYYQYKSVSIEILRDLVNLGRLSPSSGNLQELKYILSNEHKKNETIFSNLAWAAYLKDWNGPEEGEKPSAYIIILGDTLITKSFKVNHGIAAQSILLGVVEKGLGGCIFGSIDRDGLRKGLNIDNRFEILLIIAIGYPKEIVVIEDIDKGGSIKYWRDNKKIHHVPKRKLFDIIIE